MNLKEIMLSERSQTLKVWYLCYGKHKNEDYSPGWPGNKMRLYLKHNQSKKGWECGLSGRALVYQVYQVQGPEFKPKKEKGKDKLQIGEKHV
jgi:hypothetical protein